MHKQINLSFPVCDKSYTFRDFLSLSLSLERERERERERESYVT
jgi:hypothetical protein